MTAAPSVDARTDLALAPAEARVLHVVCASEPSRAERLVIDLVTHAEHTRATRAVALVTSSSELARDFERTGVRVFDRGRVRENVVANLWRSLGPNDTAWLASAIAEHRANVVHVHAFASHVLGTRAGLRAGARVVRTDHDARTLGSPFTRWSLRRAHVVVAVASHVAAAIVKAAPYAADRVTVVRRGVDTDYFAPSASARATRPFTFVMTCALEAREEVNVAIEAIARVPDARLVVVGDGSQRRKLVRMARAWRVSDRVELRGSMSDARDAIAEADAALSASHDEPSSADVLEAMSMGKPVVAFATSGIRDLVSGGKTGLLARSISTSELSARMQEAVDRPDRMRAMGVRARDYAVRELGVTAMCAGYAHVYAKVLAP